MTDAKGIAGRTGATTPTGRTTPPVVNLHIGTMKTGTSYVQGLLERDRHSLAAEGVLVPVDAGRAVHDVLELPGAASLGDVAGAWADLRAEVHRWPGDRVVLSMEFLGLASARQVEKVVASLAPSRVRVVITARDLGRTIPSAWQQTTKNQQCATWTEFLDAITADEAGRSRTGQQFWRHHDIVSITRRWAAAVGADSVTVVTVPPAGAPPEMLWRRFCTAVGLDPGQHRPDGRERRNASLGQAEAEVLRRLNVALDGRLPQPVYRRLVTGVISRQILRRGRAVTSAPVLPARVNQWAVRRSAEVIADLRSLGMRVVGDLDDLRPASASMDRSAEDSETVDESAVTAVAVHVAAALLAATDAVPDNRPSRTRPLSPATARRRVGTGQVGSDAAGEH